MKTQCKAGSRGKWVNRKARMIRAVSVRVGRRRGMGYEEEGIYDDGDEEEMVTLDEHGEVK